MNRHLVTIIAVLFSNCALAQTSPNFVTGQVPTAADWNAAFASKVDYPPNALGGTPTAMIGLTPLGGTASTFLRSNAAPALSQDIVPTWTGPHTFRSGIALTPLGNVLLQTGLTTTQTGAGTQSAFNFNQINITSDNISGGANDSSVDFVNGLQVRHFFGGPNTSGGRNAIYAYLNLASPTSPTNPYNFNAALLGLATTGQGVSDPNAFLYGVGTTVITRAGSTTGGTIAAELTAGVLGTTALRASLVLNALGGHPGKGSSVDAMMIMDNQPGAGKWDNGILLGNVFGSEHPIATTGKLIATTGNATVNFGIDISSYTFTTAAFRSPGFNVNGSGALTATLPTSAAGGGLYVCVDTAGVMYKKSTCP